MAYHSILAAIDANPNAKNVVDTAFELATTADARLMLVNVIPPLHRVYGELDVVGFGAAKLSLEGEAIKAAEQRFKRLCAAYPERKISTATRIGHPGEEVVALAQEWHADLIVIGPGRDGRRASSLGSTTSVVAHEAPCDVIIVRRFPVIAAVV